MSKDKRIHITFLALFAFIMGIAFMPNQFYAGDSYAIKLISNNLLDNGDLGIDFKHREDIKDFLKNQDQYFFENNKREKFFQRWGILNPILFSLPDIFEEGTLGLEISADQIKRHGIFNALLSSVLIVTIFLICSHFSQSYMVNSFFSLATIYSSFIWHYTTAQTYEILQLVLFNLAALFLFNYKKSKERKFRFLFNLMLVTLIFTKSVFFIVVPLFILFMEDFKIINIFKRLKLYIPELILYTVCVLFFLYLQNYFFHESFPERTAHPHDPTKIDFALAHIPDRFKEYFLSLNKGMIFYVPAIIFSLFKWKGFYKSNRTKSLFILGCFAIFTPVALSFHIYGDWCFGPRYYIFIFPLLTLPIFSIYKNSRTFKVLLFTTFFSFSCLMLPFMMRGFHFNYRIQGKVNEIGIKTRYFDKHPILISYDLLKQNDHHPLLNKLISKKISGKNYIKIEKELNSSKCKLFFDMFCL